MSSDAELKKNSEPEIAEIMGSAIEFRMPAPLKLDGGSDLLPEWLRFKQQMQIFLSAAGFERVSEARKAAIFLNCVGHDAQELYFNVLKKEDDTVKYEQLIKLFDAYFEPKQNELINAYNFNQRKQDQGETFDLFYTEIRRLVKNCNYKEQESRMLRDRIVIGVSDKKLQEKLLAINDLTLDKAVDMCRASELAKAQARAMQQPGAVEVISKQQDRPDQQYRKDKFFNNSSANPNNFSRDTYQCKKCGTRHGLRSCPAFGKTCSNCHKPNHFKIGCKFINQIKVDSTVDGDNSVHDL